MCHHLLMFLFAGYQRRADIIVPAVSVLIFVMISLFFRVSVRKIAKNKNFVYAPADGTIIAVEELFEDEYLKTTCLKVSIFMSIFNIHQNIIPVSGKIIYYKHHPGKYLVAWHPKSSFRNEHTSIVIETNDGLKLMIRQIAGFVARRIICNIKENDIVKQGEELGFILFGSRVDVFVPVHTKINVKLKQAGMQLLKSVHPEESFENEENKFVWFIHDVNLQNFINFVTILLGVLG